MFALKITAAAALTLLPLSGPQAAWLSGRVFVIDPGHGVLRVGGAPLNVGAVSPDGLSEAAINLRVGEKIATLLRAEGARVVLTRSFLGTISGWYECAPR